MMLHDLHVTSCDIQVCRLQELKLCDKSKPGCSVVRPVEAALEGQFASAQWQSTTSSPGIMFVFQPFGYRSPIGHNKSSKNIQQHHFATPNCKPSLRLSKENTSTKEPSLKRKWVYEVEEFHIYTFHAPNASCTVWLLLPLIQLELWLIAYCSQKTSVVSRTLQNSSGQQFEWKKYRVQFSDNGNRKENEKNYFMEAKCTSLVFWGDVWIYAPKSNRPGNRCSQNPPHSWLLELQLPLRKYRGSVFRGAAILLWMENNCCNIQPTTSFDGSNKLILAYQHWDPKQDVKLVSKSTFSDT